MNRLLTSPLFLAFLCFCGGLVDLWVLRFLGVEMHAQGQDVMLPVVLFFAFNFAALGYAVGHFLEARRRLEAGAQTIAQQVEALTASREAALKNEKMAALGRLSAGIAHEVRNPMGVIRASASLLQEDVPPGTDAHQAATFICEEVDRLDGFIRTLLTLAREGTAPTEPVDLGEAAAAVRTLVRDDLQGRRIDLALEVPEGLPTVHGDEKALTQLLLSLVTNAAQALGSGGKVAIRALPGPPVAVEVADSGPGISPEVGAQLFEPFFTTRPEGTGLGLAMAKRIAEGHGAGLEVRQGLGLGPQGAGACFRLTFPEVSHG